MRKEIFDILYNPSSITSCYENPLADHHDEQKDVGANELTVKQNLYLDILDKMALTRDEEQVKTAVLRLYREVLFGVPPDLRPFVLNGFNMSLKRFEVRFTKSKALFDQCLQLVVEIKTQVDRADSLQGMMTPSEWVEVEKSICHLTRWQKNFTPAEEEVLVQV